MKKIILAIVLITLLALSLAGCAADEPSEKIERPASEVADAQAPAPAPAGDESCEILTFPEGCGADDVTCQYNTCWTKDELYDTFGECDFQDGSAQECHDTACTGCSTGFKSCYSTHTDRGSFDFCAECVTDYHCKEGVKCEMGKCVPA